MASYRLRAQDVTYYRKAAADYRERPTGYRAQVPIELIPTSYISKWYVLTNPVGPKLSREGRASAGVAVSRTEDEAKVVFMRSDFQIPYTEAASAQRNGIPLQADIAKRALANVHNKIGQMIYTGLDQPYVINGMTEDGTDLGGTLDAVLWGTAGEAIDHADALFSHFQTYGYGDGPFKWMCTTSLSGDLKQPYSTGSDKSTGQFIDSAFNFQTYFEPGIATTSFDASEDANPIYMIEWTEDDGVWIGFVPSVEHMALQETGPPQVWLDPALNRETNSYHGGVIWQGTWRTTNNTAIGFMEDVDLA